MKPTGDVRPGTETILLVDDEKIILEVGGEMLKEMGYTVIEVDNGRKAVDIYKEKGRDIDLVILDMIMPDMDGAATYERLHQMNPDIKVLLASGYSQTRRVSKILEQGFHGFIQKPFNMIRLSKKIRSMLQPEHDPQ